ncbi:hypothetical protein Tsubulata_023669 [Turnera subulata]|uniref:Major facilitator superfamily (MFS) profile domain-containing protein n=1 Tax=Turnera subulata TaxID=218843 RepID=A0A9Q0G008_9ROSI|nr:hypothetical protein Tsubulata_023669 [Turnera subulata]
MAHDHADVENSNGNISEPFIGKKENGSLGMVLICTAIAVCGSFVYGTGVGYSAPTQFGIMKELNLTYSEVISTPDETNISLEVSVATGRDLSGGGWDTLLYSVFGSILNIGAMIGAVTSGRVADFLGRKGAMRTSAIICIAGWLSIYAAMESLLLDFGRFLTGYGCGILSYVVPVFIAEITPKDLRGALATANQLFIVIGLALAYVIGTWVNWRTLALIGALPCLIMLIGLSFIPESPRWLAMVGHHVDFDAALRALRGPTADISVEKTDILDSLALLQKLPKVTMLDLFHRRNIRLVIVGVGLMAFQQLSGINGIIFYAGHIFSSAGVPSRLASTIYPSIQILVTAVGAALIDKAGRRPLLLVSASGLLIANLLLGTSYLLGECQLALEFVPLMALTGVLLFVASFSIGMGAIPWVLMSELFPLNIKGRAGSLVTLVNWLGSWIVSFTFIFLREWSSFGTFYLYGLVCAMSIIFIFKLVPETKGRTLEDIHSSLS